MENMMMQSILKGQITEKYGQTLVNFFQTSVRKYPNKTAVLYEDDDGDNKSISFKLMNVLSSRIAKVFIRYCGNSSSNGIIAISLRPTEMLPVILLAILKAGMSYLPIDVEFPAERIQYILQDAQPLICIIEETANASIYNKSITLTEKQLIFESEIEIETLTTDNDVSKIAIVLYTSGSTGTPKGVCLQYSALMNRLMWQWKEFPFNKDEDYCICKTALTFVDCVSEIWAPLLQGRTLIVVSRHTAKDPEKLIGILNKYKIQRIVLVPSLLRSLLLCFNFKKDKDSLKMLKLWVCSGETLPVTLVKEFFFCFAGQVKTIANFYGSTEIMGDVVYHLVTENDLYLKENRIPIGKPIDNCEVYIVDQYLNLLPDGEIGEMLVAGRNLANGYIGDKNSYKFINNPYSLEKDFSKVFRTGDYARIENNQLFYEGRQDNQIKIRGHRVDLSEIQKAVTDLHFIEDAVILPYKYDDSDQVILCFIVLKEGRRDIKIKEIKFLLSETLLHHMIPRIIIIDSIPLLSNGKTDRKRLLERYKTDNKGENKYFSYNYSEVPLELLSKAKILFPTIASVVGLDENSHINVHSNFYELGGNSLNSIYTILKLREQGFYIGITDFLTAKDMTEILNKMKIDNIGSIDDDTIDTKQYVLEMLNDSHKDQIIKIITESFFTKADLERWLLPDIKKSDYFDLMQELWGPLVKKNFSFVLKSTSNNKIVSVALNFDATDEPQIVIESKLNIIFDFLEHLEKPIREKRLPEGKNQIFHTFMMATDNELSSAENVILMRLMEQKCLEIAKESGFAGILTTNTSPLTQQLGTDVFSYEVMLDYQVNKYVAHDGSRPFAEAPDDQRATVSWKKISF